MLSLIPLFVSVLSLVVSFFAFWNSRKERLDSKKETVFQLKMDALRNLKEAESQWLLASEELFLAKEWLTGPDFNPKGAKFATSYYEQLEQFFRRAHKNAAELLSSFEGRFDECSEAEARKMLRICELGKISLERDVASMRRKLPVLENKVNVKAP